jgi:hypothetical protein
MTSIWLLQTSIPSDPHEIDAWLGTSSERVLLALNVRPALPSCGSSACYAIASGRRRTSSSQSFFLAALFSGMLFVSAAAMGALNLAHRTVPEALFNGATFAFAGAFTYNLMHIYAFKMVRVFMITTSTLALNTHITPRWIVLLGDVSAVLILIGSGFLDSVLFVIPCLGAACQYSYSTRQMEGAAAAGRGP